MKNTLLIFILLASINLHGQMTKIVYKTIGTKTVYSIENYNVLIVTSGFGVDADGAPHAYHQNNDIALDYLTNAGKPGDWWALATDNKKPSGNPLVQTPSDPAPGYYISMTALIDPLKKYEDPNRYVNSDSIPYVVIPLGFSNDFKLGDIALVYNKANKKKCFAISADIGSKNNIGEGSIYLAKQLGIKNSPKNGGTAAGVFYIFIKNSGNGKVLSRNEINEIGNSKLTESIITELIKESK
jgi:hypothetical protein